MIHEILIVDDEINSLKVLTAALSTADFHIETARSGDEALTLLKMKHYDLIISDYKMPGMSGEDLLARARIMMPDVPFILLTAFGTIELAVNAMRLGAYTYLTKPVNLALLEEVIKDALLPSGSAAETPSASAQFYGIIGRSKAMQEVFSLIRRVSKTDANILILGESGTGKELVARAIHYSSLRKDKPFIPIDCTTIPGELMESELFGYEKGAFTGAVERKIGLIEMAQGGTLFLDEIGDLDYALEKKLLRFLQEKEIHRLGGKGKISVDVRVLSATNRNIESEVDKGDFRADLYYRLNVITIHIPALRERKEDIPLLAGHCLNRFAQKYRKSLRGFDQDFLTALKNYDWPGNVRELENTIERAIILCPHDTIAGDYLPAKLRTAAEPNHIDELNLPEMEKRTITRALDKSSWNQSHAAQLLGISRKQLRTKMKNLGLVD
jgi:two-component system response regulator HydG/two-component system response regulator AtoC